MREKEEERRIQPVWGEKDAESISAGGCRKDPAKLEFSKMDALRDQRSGCDQRIGGEEDVLLGTDAFHRCLLGSLR